MYLSSDGTDLVLRERRLQIDGATGGSAPLWTLRSLDESTGAVAEATLRMEPWAPEGFRVHDWRAADALVLCGAKQLKVLAMDTLEGKAAIPLEFAECETAELPWFVEAGDELIVATETRVFCLDIRLAIRWVWTVRVHSDEWWCVGTAPKVMNGTVRIAIHSPNRQVAVTLSLADASPC